MINTKYITLLKNIIKFILNLSNIQKTIVLILLLNILTKGMWLGYFTTGLTNHSVIALRMLMEHLNIVLIVGFFLFWNIKKDE